MLKCALEMKSQCLLLESSRIRELLSLVLAGLTLLPARRKGKERASMVPGEVCPDRMVSVCSRKNFVFLFGALINLTVRVDAYFHLIRMT